MFKFVVLSAVLSLAVAFKARHTLKESYVFKSNSMQTEVAKKMSEVGVKSNDGPIIEEAKEIVGNLFGP